MNRKTWFLLGFLLLAVLSCLIAGGSGIFFGLAFGGGSTAIIPDFNFGLVADWACPEGSELVYEQVKYSYNEPGEYTIEASCISADGTETRGQELKLVGLVMLAYGLMCFTPLLLIGLVISALIIFLASKVIPANNQEQMEY